MMKNNFCINLIILCLAQILNAQTDTTIYAIAEEMPRFYCSECEILETIAEKKQCADKKMLKFMYSNFKFPVICREMGIEGGLFASFVINQQGQMQDIQMLKKVHPELDSAYLAIFYKMQKKHTWIAGKTNGKSVRIRYHVPMRYKPN